MSAYDYGNTKPIQHASRWQLARNVFYILTLVGTVLLGLWMRFTSTGLEWFYKFMLHAGPGIAPTEHLVGYKFAVIGLFSGAGCMMLAMLIVESRYKRRIPPLGGTWCIFCALVVGFAGPFLYGHFFLA